MIKTLHIFSKVALICIIMPIWNRIDCSYCGICNWNRILSAVLCAIIQHKTHTAAHYVTPDKTYKDAYSGDFGSDAIMPGKQYTFLFTQEATIPYYCEVHPWMKGEIDIVHGALTS